MDWSVHYPAFVDQEAQSSATKDGGATHGTDLISATVEPSSRKRMTRQVEVADIGCGFGGLLFALAPKMPDTLIMGRPSFRESFTLELGLTHVLQAWRFVSRLPSSSRTRSVPCASSSSIPQPYHHHRQKTPPHLQHHPRRPQRQRMQQATTFRPALLQAATRTSPSFAPTP